MSKFVKALEEAERDRSLRNGAAGEEVHPLSPISAAPLIEVKASTEDSPALTIPSWHDGVDEHLVSLVRPTTFEAEQYRALRHVVEQRRRAAGLTVLAISSPGAGDGKTITSINLAGALSQAPEARVLLVDADLRQPALGRLLGFGETIGPGLVGAILDRRVTLEQVVLSRPPYNLSVVCAGAIPASPYDLLKSPRFGELLEEARHSYDYVVLDTPPLIPVQDCRVIDRWVDGFLLVVTALRTPRRLVEEALTVLDRKKILGFVFNADEEPSASDRQSRYYISYQAPSLSASGGRRGLLQRAASTLGDSLRSSRRYRFHERDPRSG